MKKTYLYISFLLLTMLFGCEQSQLVENNNLPKQETALIQQFNKINDKLSAQVNDAGKKDVIDSAEVQTSNFIKKDLNLKIERWHAYVHEVRGAVMTETIEDNVFGVNVFIPLKNSYDKENPTFYTITLICLVKRNNKKLMNIVKTLKPFDRVLISCTFKMAPNKHVDLSNFGLTDENSFISPEFITELEDIVKL